MESFDVVVAGGAAMGSSVAMHLAADPDFRGRVLVVEKDPAYTLSASALSLASIRQQYSNAINVHLSLYGIAFLRAAAETLGVPGKAPPALSLREGGYLYCAGPVGAPVLAANHAVQVAEGADVALLDSRALRARFPWLEADDLALGSFGLTGEGWFDGWALLSAYRARARHLGAEYRTGTVAGIDVAGGRVTGVRLADGGRIACGMLVNAAGSGGPALAAAAGAPIPVVPKRRSIFTFACRESLPGFPLLIDVTGVFVRPDGEGRFVCGVSPAAHEDPDWHDHDPATREVDWHLFEERIWPALAHRVPAFAAIRPGRAWTGPYDMCLLDGNAIIGPVAGLDGFLFCNGFSGHGLQHSPAVGRALAELVVQGRYRTLDLSDLGHARVAAGRPFREANII